MARAKAEERSWLRQLARHVLVDLGELLADPLVVLSAPGQLKAETETDGWIVELGRVKGLSGTLAFRLR